MLWRWILEPVCAKSQSFSTPIQLQHYYSFFLHESCQFLETSQQNYATNLEQFAPYVGSLGDVGWFRYTGAVHMKVVKVGKSGQFLSSWT